MSGSKTDLRVRLGSTLWYLFETPRQMRFSSRSRRAIEAQQRRRLAQALSHAHSHVPYYRETMGRLGLAPGDFNTPADLARLPLLRREDVQRDPERFVSQSQPIERYLRRQTGGSSGQPLTVYYDHFSTVQGAAHHQRAGSLHRRIARRRLGCRTLLIGPPSPQEDRRGHGMPERFGKFAAMETRRVPIIAPIEEVIDEIERFRPHIVCSHGSYLERLFDFLKHSGRRSHRPRLVLYGGDAMSSSGRELISEELGIPVLSVYGAYEAPCLGFECPEHLGFHLNVDLNPVRIVDRAGCEVPDGESGEVVISNLVNRGTVLLNYRLGDVASKLPRECSCGCPLPLLSFLEGRLDDWVMTAGGERMHPQGIRTLFSDEEEVRRYQVVQRSSRQFEVTLVEAPGCDRKRLEARLAAKFSGRLGEGTRIEVSFVDSLAHTARGKVRTVIGLSGGDAGQGG